MFLNTICAGSIGQVPVLLAKPQTYMNFSGESVCPPCYVCYVCFEHHLWMLCLAKTRLLLAALYFSQVCITVNNASYSNFFI